MSLYLGSFLHLLIILTDFFFDLSFDLFFLSSSFLRLFLSQLNLMLRLCFHFFGLPFSLLSSYSICLYCFLHHSQLLCSFSSLLFLLLDLFFTPILTDLLLQIPPVFLLSFMLQFLTIWLTKYRFHCCAFLLFDFSPLSQFLTLHLLLQIPS